MKIILTITLLLSTIISSIAQIIYKDSIAPKIEITHWINNSEGMSILENKPIILEFWSTWCGPCVKAIPNFNQLTERYNKDITFISVNSYETKTNVENFLLKKPMSSFVALDESENLKNAFNVQSIPVTILIDKNGMLRWRGITSELTDDLISTFLTENKFNDIYNKGIILDQVFSASSLENIDYQLQIEYGDATLGKGITTNSEGEFFLKLNNYSIYSVLWTFSDRFDLKDNWKFEGNLPDREIINLMIKSDVEIKDELDAQKLIYDITLKLAETFNFSIVKSEEIQSIWYITPDTSQLGKNLSIDQNLDIKVLEQTDDYTKYQNLFFEFLASVLSLRTKEKVEYNPLTAPYYYDIIIPKSNDILEIRKYLKEEYGIDMVEKREKVKIKTATFN